MVHGAVTVINNNWIRCDLDMYLILAKWLITADNSSSQMLTRLDRYELVVCRADDNEAHVNQCYRAYRLGNSCYFVVLEDGHSVTSNMNQGPKRQDSSTLFYKASMISFI